MSEDVELRKCPHCGGEAFLDDINSSYRKDRGPLWAVGCANNDCIVETRAIHDDKLTAIAAWNRRPTPAPADASGWRPIESAPRGRNVLVHTETWGVTEAILGDDGWQIASMNGLLAKGDPTAWQPLPPPPGSTPPRPIDMGEIERALEDVRAERERQKTVEGWTPKHDDEHQTGDLARAAVCYADPVDKDRENAPPNWPWDEAWWNPKDRRRDLVRAAALLLAEIERLDRQALAAIKGAGA